MYSSEVFGQRHRQVGMSLAVATNFSLAGVITAVALVADPATVYWANFIKAFAVLDGLAILVVWVFMRTPGARGNTLEDMHVSVPVDHPAPISLQDLSIDRDP